MIPKFISDPDPELYLHSDHITLDIETTNLDKGTAINQDNRIVLAVTKLNDDRPLLWDRSGDLKDYLKPLLDNHYIVAQNAKFDLQWIKRLGIDLSRILVFDTQIAEYVLLGNIRKPLDLGSIAKRRGYGGKDPFIDICMKGGICPSEMPRPLLEKRCVKDVNQTYAIFLEQLQQLEQRDQLKTLYTRCILTPVLADIEFNGLYLDGEAVEETYTDYIGRFRKSEEALGELSGGINLGSAKQRGEFLYDTLGFSELKDRRGDPIRTPGGGRKTDGDTIAGLKTSTPEQHTFVRAYKEYNQLKAALSKNLDFFLGVVRERASTFYGQFNQTITRSHRLSSSGRALHFALFNKNKSVQFQNLPRVFKKLFKARKDGWSIGEIDGSQLEFRVAAHLGRDTAATEAIRNKFDVHTKTATVLTANGQATDRQGAKAHTFKPLYGGRSGTKAEKAYYQDFRDSYPGIANTQSEWINKVLATKELTIPSGLTFYWPDTKVEGNYITNTPSICNYPVQSYATGDIIPIAVTKLWHELKANNLESFITNTVHDSAIAEIHPQEKEKFSELAFQAFTDYVYYYLDKVYDDKFTVPLGAEMKIGTHWSVGEEEERSMEPPHI